MRPAREWKDELAATPPPAGLERVEGRGGLPTLKVGNVFLHSRYDPVEEARRFVDAAELDPTRPVLVVGLGLGYHVDALRSRGIEVAVVEPDRAVAALAVAGRWSESDIPLGVGDAESVAASAAFRKFAGRLPQVLAHPPTARLHAGYAERIGTLAARAALGEGRLNIAVVGPMYGGSLPIAGYLARAFEELGHRTRYVDNSAGWPVFEEMRGSIERKKVADDLGNLLVNYLGEWSYARVMEFEPEICIVVAQAPVGKNFPLRLARQGIVTAFWYIENWRHLPYWRDIAPLYDHFFHIQPGEFEEQLDAVGCSRHAFVQTGCDPAVHRPVELSDEERAALTCDISFAGAGYYNRNQLFAGLTDYDLALWGVDWTHRDLQRHVRRPNERFTADLFARIVAASRINLNLHSSTSHPGVDPASDAINPRVFEIAACGGFQVCDPCRNLEMFFEPETELPMYRSLAELREKIDHYLAHPEEREAVARRARARALRDHTYAQRARQMLDIILEHNGGHILNRGIRVQRTVSEVADRVGRDSELGRYLASLPPDVLFTQQELNRRLPTGLKAPSRPEAVFMLLREIRNSSEAILGERNLLE